MALIEKEPIMKFIEDGLNNKHYGHVGVEIITEIEYAPTFARDSEGYWINAGEEKECSHCHGVVTGWHEFADCRFPRCPWCGAHMRSRQ